MVVWFDCAKGGLIVAVDRSNVAYWWFDGGLSIALQASPRFALASSLYLCFGLVVRHSCFFAGNVGISPPAIP